MAISRLATSNPASNTDILLYTGLRTILSSVIATNKSSTPATIRVWAIPLDQDATPANHVFISYDVSIGGNDTLETFRFPVLLGDKVYVRASTANISFSLSGIDDTNIAGTELADLEASIAAAQLQADKALVYGLIGI
jgi:hypothetical protein